MIMKLVLSLLLGFALLVGCASPPTQPPPATATPTLFVPATTQLPLTLPPGGATPDPNLTPTPGLPGGPNICLDPQVIGLIDSLKAAFLNSDGLLLSSRVSPPRGMDVAFFRDGTVVNYTPEQAKFLFETTFEVNWGAEPGSGIEKVGAFHDVVAPELVKAFSQPYTLHCNELKHGGATYELVWPYEGNFYSVHYPGTQANGFLDWNTWAVGIEYVNNEPKVYALMRFFWEP